MSVVQRTMAWRFEGRLGVVLHTSRSPSNLEWQSMLRDAVAASNESARFLIVSHGGGPDGYQRELLGRAIANKTVFTSLMTKSGLVQAMALAMFHFNRHLKVFGLADRKEAYHHLGLSDVEAELADRMRSELEAELGLAARVG